MFEQTNKVKYHTDFREFLFESSIEDFCDISGTDIVVSTIHKSKGREFDDVYMLITKPQSIQNEVLRRYYVGATRAKERLFIHTDASIFDRMPADEHHVCLQQYDMPDEIILQLSHKDVNLGFSKSVRPIFSLYEQVRHFGSTITIYLNVVQIRQSANCRKRCKASYCSGQKKGYSVVSASIRFIVAWRPKDAPKDEKEHAVLLVNLSLKKEL